MNYSDLELKFIRHALDTNSQGEAGNAAAMFFKELLKRGIKAQQFIENKSGSTASTSGDSNLDYKVLYEVAYQEKLKACVAYTQKCKEARFAQDLASKAGVALEVERGARLRAEEALALAQSKKPPQWFKAYCATLRKTTEYA